MTTQLRHGLAATAQYSEITWRVMRRLNRKAAFLRFIDSHIGWAIALCYLAAYGLIRGISGS